MKEDEAWLAIVETMSNRGLKKKKQFWYEILPGGIRGVNFAKSRWRDKDNQEYDPELCLYPIEFLEHWDGRKIPPSYQFPIQMSPMHSLGPDAWKKIKPYFDSEICIEYQTRKEGIENFLNNHFQPIFLKIKSFERAKEMCANGDFPDFAFRMPAREFLLNRGKDS